MALPSGFSTALSKPTSIRLVLLALVVMPVAVLVLPFNVDGHRINPRATTITRLTRSVDAPKVATSLNMEFALRWRRHVIAVLRMFWKLIVHPRHDKGMIKFLIGVRVNSPRMD